MTPVAYAEAVAAAAQVLTDARAARDALSPREAALAAHVPGGPSVAELEARIRADRAAAASARAAS